ncbi:MAG: trypsin [Gammaproteobacteria bacterium]|nr:trypsin [Gammaproteobacteria bacterium]MAY02550.1 trypsin [Gammaproteobacteria bacterium]|tara:strand:- start:2909 stop:3640 length:732 start_codon:yes stop_codon:yes gene_type:complete
MIEPILLTATQILTYEQGKLLTNASGFFFERDGRLFLVTSRHVVQDEPSQHNPDRIEIQFHVDLDNAADIINFSIPLFQNGQAVWRQGIDNAGEIDVAVIEIDKVAMPVTAVYLAFTPQHMPGSFEEVAIGTSMLIIGFPLGFHDTLHYFPIARHASSASSFRLRFQGQGYFLTDARTHRGMSGAPVVMRDKSKSSASAPLPWKLLGIHSARLDVGTRDVEVDEALGLNCAWFADILLTLTKN